MCVCVYVFYFPEHIIEQAFTNIIKSSLIWILLLPLQRWGNKRLKPLNCSHTASKWQDYVLNSAYSLTSESVLWAINSLDNKSGINKAGEVDLLPGGCFWLLCWLQWDKGCWICRTVDSPLERLRRLSGELLGWSKWVKGDGGARIHFQQQC